MARLTPDDRRRQLLGIGLRMFVDRPVQEVSIDAVAAEAGISRGLLFHYFPSKTAYHQAVVAAAGRRFLRNARPDDGVVGEAALEQVTRRFVEQIRRRRAFYVALVFGQSPVAVPTPEGEPEFATSLRGRLADLVIERCGFAASDRPVVHAWVAYVEDRAIESAPDASPAEVDALVAHCTSVLPVLTATD